MQIVRLNFYGYTWETFKWQIANQKGILLTYRGKLHPEGSAVMEEILHIGYTSIKELYETSLFDEIKKNMTPTDMIFYSYANIDKSIATEVESLLVETVKPRYNNDSKASQNIIIENRGNCALLPELIISNKE